jgi:hypothetical protein
VILVAVTGAGALIAMLATWWLRRRRAAATAFRKDDTIPF